MKKLITLALVLTLSATTPTQGSGVGSVFDKIAAYALKASQTIIFAADLITVALYPNEYIRKINQIIRDINGLKSIARQTNLNPEALVNLSKMLVRTTEAANTISTECSSLLATLNEYNAMMLMGKPVKLADVLKDIKTSHKKNMKELNAIHATIYTLRNSLAQKNALQNALDQAQIIKIYK